MDEGGEANLNACARLLAAAPGQAEVDLLLRGMDKALEGRRLVKAPPALQTALTDLRKRRPNDLTLLRLAVRLGGADAYERKAAQKRAGDAKVPDADRIALIDLLGQTDKVDCVPTLLKTLAEAKSDAVRAAVLTALQPFTDQQIAAVVLSLYPRLSADLKARAQSLLCGRAASGLELLKAVDAGRIVAREVPLDQLRRLEEFKDVRIDQLIAKYWGKITPATTGEKLTQIRNLGATLISHGTGDRVVGKEIFTKNCAACHTLFGEGGKIGPDLTGGDRKNRVYLMTQIIDPSRDHPPGIAAYVVNTKDGRAPHRPDRGIDAGRGDAGGRQERPQRVASRTDRRHEGVAGVVDAGKAFGTARRQATPRLIRVPPGDSLDFRLFHTTGERVPTGD